MRLRRVSGGVLVLVLERECNVAVLVRFLWLVVLCL